MKTAMYLLLAMIMPALIMGCEDGSNLLDQQNDVAPLVPVDPPEKDPNAPRPPASAPVISTTRHEIIDTAGQPVLLRGANLLYADNRATALAGVRPLKAAGSNVVRLQVGPNITAANLELALEGIIANNMIALLVYDDAEKIACKEDDDALLFAVENYWLGEWLPVLAQERFQSHLMINIASKWGVMNVWDAASKSYGAYVDTYKSMIGRVRDAGFKVPLVIDAPNCGEDFNAFLGGRGRTLLTADSESNIVFSVHAFGGQWNSSRKVVDATTSLYQLGVPFIFGEFGGLDYGGDAAVDHLELMAKGAGDKALVFNFPWTSTADRAAYVHNLNMPIDLVGSVVTVDVYVPKQYKKDGKLNIELYVKDGDYRFASFAPASVSQLKGDAWNRLKYTVSGASDFGGYVTAGFDPSVIRQIGVQVSANGKPADITGDLKFDNLVVAFNGGAEPEYEITFSSDLGNWYHAWGDALRGEGLTVVDGQMSFAPAWTEAEGKVAVRVDSARFTIDFAQELFFKLRIFIPEYFATQETVALKFFAHHGPSWGGWGQTNELTFSALTPGQWNDLTFTATNMLGGGEPVQAFGFEIGGVSATAGSETAPILVDSIVVGTAEQLNPPTATVFSSNFDTGLGGWANREWSAINETLTNVNGEAHITPDWSKADQLAIGTQAVVSANELDLTSDVRFKADIFLPVGTVAGGFYFKFFLQDDDWTYAGSEIVSLDAFTLGEWTTVELAMPAANYGSDYDRTKSPNVVGIQFGNVSSTPGGIRIDNVAIIGEAMDESSVVLVDIDFDTEEEFNSFVFDFGGGGLDMTTLSAAKQHELGVMPFGWVASSWHGSSGAKSVLDMSTIPGFVEGTANTDMPMLDLTQRGVDIILSPNGISATSTPANFPAAP